MRDGLQLKPVLSHDSAGTQAALRWGAMQFLKMGCRVSPFCVSGAGVGGQGSVCAERALDHRAACGPSPVSTVNAQVILNLLVVSGTAQ